MELNKELVTIKQQPAKTTINKTKTTSALSIENQEKYYNKIAVDDTFKMQVDTNGFNKDRFGNLDGNTFDLAMDFCFNGKIIAIFQICGALAWI